MSLPWLSYVTGMKILLVNFVILCIATTPALAQTAGPEEIKPAAPAARSNTGEPVAPYDDKLLRLSEILGSVHYLRTLCGADEGNKWRDTMSAILAAEAPGPNRRARLVAHFNRGYRTFNGSYSSCTASALLASERYMAEGAELSKQITQRYGR